RDLGSTPFPYTTLFRSGYFGLRYLDTGSIYRAVGYKMLQKVINPENEAEAIAIAKNITPEDTENEHLYDEGVGRAASIISAMPKDRKSTRLNSSHVEIS